MKENLKIAAKIGGKTAVHWTMIMVLGNLITLITFLVAIFTNIGFAGGAHGNVLSLILGLFLNNIPALILVCAVPLFLALYFIIANKSSLQKAIYLLWKSNLGDFISAKVGALTKSITEKEGWGREISNKALLEARILHIAKNDTSTSKFQRKIIQYGFKKINLDDIDFQDENINVSQVLTQKFSNFISDTAKPSMKLFWILALFQIVLMVVSLFFT